MDKPKASRDPSPSAKEESMRHREAPEGEWTGWETARDHARTSWLAARRAHVEATARYRALIDEIDAWRAGAKVKHAFLRGRHGR